MISKYKYILELRLSVFLFMIIIIIIRNRKITDIYYFIVKFNQYHHNDILLGTESDLKTTKSIIGDCQL